MAQKSKNKSLRRIFLTWNNWNVRFKDKEEVVEYFEGLNHFRGAIIGFEVGEEGTPHLQAVVAFTQPKSFNLLRKYFENNHIEQVKHMNNAVEYCKKDGDFIELGELLGQQGKRTDIHEFRDAIVARYTNGELMEYFPSQFFRFHHSIEKVRQEILEEEFRNRMRDVKVVFVGGKTGIGKTHFLYHQYREHMGFEFSDIIRINDYRNPFDYYRQEHTLAFDEFDGSIHIRDMLNYLDKYPLSLPARYSNRVAAYEVVFIFSNLKFEEIYRWGVEPATYDAWKRRFDFIGWAETREEMEQIGEEIIELFFNK